MSSPTNPYASVHASPQGPGDARPTALQIISDCGLINVLVGKVIFVTGGSGGIGVEIVRALHATGADVYMQVRNVEKGESVRKDILETSPGNGQLEIVEMELADLESVRNGMKGLLEKTGTVNVLVNNAGIRNPPETITKDGFELTFGTNHVAHFLIFQLLLPTLLKSASESLQSSYPFASRVINVSSAAHRAAPMNLENPNMYGIYEPRKAYGQSKTAKILMANEIERRFGSKGVHGLSISPGAVRSGAQRYDDPVRLNAVLAEYANILKLADQGAATTVWAAVAPVWEGKGGVYLENCKEQECVEGDEKVNLLLKEGYAKHAFDVDVAKELWKMSCKMVGLPEKDRLGEQID
ncbi:putative short-chain dehydrogenase [Rhodocollybia butyracea]|uniref:Short-chain dehydrogenase n=1 Tax=Rhodocollybia butyracea TaxID=206335 RepID=A0A9P5PTW8_9AGAR|nr:putative short-chain dehydrogenase [Rhodocollybia butyracea]